MLDWDTLVEHTFLHCVIEAFAYDCSMDEGRLLMMDFARKNPLGSVATVSGAGEPSLATVYVFPHTDFTFYFGTRSSTQKFKDIGENPHVAVALSNAHTLETLQMRGTAELVTDAESVRGLLDTLRNTFAHEKQAWMSSSDVASRGIYHHDVSHWVPPVAQIHEGSYAFFKITPHWARYRRYDTDAREDKKFTEYLVTSSLVTE